MGLSLIGHCWRLRTQHRLSIGNGVLTPAVSRSVLYDYNKWPVGP